MYEDYIKVCGHNGENEKGERQDLGSSSGASNQNQSYNSESSSYDEGYGRHEGSPKVTMRSLVHVAKPEDICDVRLYFSQGETGK